MSWLELKNGLLLKLADLLQTLAALLTPKAHAPGLQEDAHPPAEDDFRAQWIKRYKTSRPPEDWLKLVAENSGSAGSASIDGKVEQDRLPSPATQADAKTQAHAVMPPRIEPVPGKQPQPLQQPRPKLTESQLKSKQESLVAPAATSALPHPPRIESAAQELSSVKQVPELVTESALMFSAGQSTELSSPIHKSNVPAEPPRQPKQESWLSRTVRRIAAKLRPAAQSPAISQTRRAAVRPAWTNYVEQRVVSGETDATITQEREPLSLLREQERRKTSSVNSAKSVPTEPIRLPRHRLSLPELNEIIGKHESKHESDDASGATLQTPLRRQKDTTAPVVPWPTPPARIAGVERMGGAENGHGGIPVPASFHNRERNLTTAAASSWTLPADQEIAPGLPSLPAEFRSGQTDNSEALYPWPELPQIVEEDADEPRKLLQNHERQLRVLREQRGAW